jgi:hypothetical protein
MGPGTPVWSGVRRQDDVAGAYKAAGLRPQPFFRNQRRKEAAKQSRFPRNPIRFADAFRLTVLSRRLTNRSTRRHARRHAP